jgi:cytidyltransferase-like protein
MIVYTGGTFDVPHIGHVKFLQFCKQYFPECELVVALNTDEFIKQFKGKAPLFSYQERENYLYLTGIVNQVVRNFGGADSRQTILSVNPHVVAVGNDWLERDYPKQMGFDAQWLTDHDIALIFIQRPGGLSSTMIKERLKNA